jgi:tetratricopeptide (TPR) repeat protein
VQLIYKSIRMKKSLFVTLFSLLSAYSAVFAQKIQDLYQKKDYAAVVALAEKSDSLTAQEWYRTGRSYLNLDNEKEALKSFNKALAQGMDSANVHFFKGYAHKNLKEYDNALAAFEQAAKRDSIDQYVWNELGYIYLKMNQLDKAMVQFQKAVECPQEILDPYMMVSYLHLMKKNYKKTLECLEKWSKILEKEEEMALKALQIREAAYFGSKDYKKSLEVAEKMLENDLLEVPFYEYVMKSASRLKKWKHSEATFQKVKKAVEDHKVHDSYVERKAVAVDEFQWDDTTEVIIVKFFKTPEQFAEPIYKAYIKHIEKDSTMWVIMTEKSFSLSGDGTPHMLCGRRGSAHLNFGYTWKTNDISLESFEQELIRILEKRRTPAASSTSKR